MLRFLFRSYIRLLYSVLIGNPLFGVLGFLGCLFQGFNLNVCNHSQDLSRLGVLATFERLATLWIH